MSENLSLEALAGRVARLEDEIAIVRVLNQYAHAIDYGDEDAWVDCFTKTAVWEVRNPVTGGVLHCVGHDELARFIAGHTRAPALYHKHVVTEPQVDVDGDSATSACYYVLLVQAPGGMPEVATFGRYIDEFRRETDGRWRISNRLAEAEAWNPMWAELREQRRGRIAAQGEPS